MALLRVYLDQRDWIRLAREHYRLSIDNGIAGVLAVIREASASGYASFPLSAVHYDETWTRSAPDSRQRLGAFMAEISNFHTIADAPNLLEAEVHASVCSIAGVTARLQPQPFGRGSAHAFGRPAGGYFTDHDLERQAISQFGVDAVFEFFETAMITGPDFRLPDQGIAAPTRLFAQRQLDFESDTAQRLRTAGHSSDLAHRVVLYQEWHGVSERVNAVCKEIDRDPHTIIAADKEAWTDFMLSLPAKGAVCRMRMSAHEDQKFRWQIGDLNDIIALGTAAAYCDVVIAENQWGNVLRRHAEHLRATVTSNLLDLPRLLVA